MTDALQYALAYAREGFACLPVWSVTPGADQYQGCQCGASPCPHKAGKHPVTHLAHSGSKSATTDPATLTQWFSGTGHNIGIAPQPGQVVIDVDFRVPGIEARWAELSPRIPPTLTVSTGQGLHLYFTCPTDARYRGKLEDGIDVKPAGQYVAAPPSMHWTGKQYTWVEPLQPMAPLPEWLALQLQAEQRAAAHEQQCDWPDVCSPEQYAQELEWLKAQPPKTKAGPPNNERFNRIVRLAKTGMSTDRILQCIEESHMLDGWHVPTDPDKLWADADRAVNQYRSENLLALPEMVKQYAEVLEREVPKPAYKTPRASAAVPQAQGARERYTAEAVSGLVKKLTRQNNPHAKSDGQNISALTRGLAVPIAGVEAAARRLAGAKPLASLEDYLRGGALAAGLMASDVTAEQFQAWYTAEQVERAGSAYTYTESGDVECNLANMVAALRQHPDWAGVIRHNGLACSAEFIKEPPMPAHVRPNSDCTGYHRDQHNRWAQTWFEVTLKMRPTDKQAMAAIETAAMCDAYHPVQEYLESLTWDENPRLDQWLQRYAGVEDNAYTQAVGAKTLIAAVARAMKPGSKVDTVLILEGPQGKRKSTLLRTLIGPDWFSDTALDVGSKDAYENVKGLWACELAEMASHRKADQDRFKAFISSPVDRFRKSYGHISENHPRQCIFFGTINPEGNGYLTDTTGGRRFWPVACGEHIDIEGLTEDRDQLWAEALVRYQAGETWWLDETVEAQASEQQAARTEVDPWTDSVLTWLQRAPVEFTASTVLDVACKVEVQHHTLAYSQRIGRILAPLVKDGLLKMHRPRQAGQRVRTYIQVQKPGYLAPVVDIQRKP